MAFQDITLYRKWRHWREHTDPGKGWLAPIHLDGWLLFGIIILMLIDFAVLYSSANSDLGLVGRQGLRFVFAFIVMFLLAQIPPNKYRTWTPFLFYFGIILLSIVLFTGHIGKGAQRWLNLGLFRFQPSELMKLTTPMMVAWYLSHRSLPPRLATTFISSIFILIPTLIIAKQPDLGTAIVVAMSGFIIIFLAGIRWRWILSLLVLVAACLPVLWHFMHSYQRGRILTFLNPERDPLGEGYHIIQSKIAIGSGGLSGKGWLHGTQSNLNFLPEHSTDFIFSVIGEEFGFIGVSILLLIYGLITLRCLSIAYQAQDQFTRLLAGGIGLTFFLSAFINIGMVSGILPVVGLPLPLLSYGGTSIVASLAGFGLLMSIYTHRKLVAY